MPCSDAREIASASSSDAFDPIVGLMLLLLWLRLKIAQVKTLLTVRNLKLHPILLQSDPN